MPKCFQKPTKEHYASLRTRLKSLCDPIEVEAAEKAVIALDLVRRKGRMPFNELLPYAQSAVAALAMDEPRYGRAKLTTAALQRAFFRVARRTRSKDES